MRVFPYLLSFVIIIIHKLTFILIQDINCATGQRAGYDYDWKSSGHSPAELNQYSNSLEIFGRGVKHVRMAFSPALHNRRYSPSSGFKLKRGGYFSSPPRVHSWSPPRHTHPPYSRHSLFLPNWLHFKPKPVRIPKRIHLPEIFGFGHFKKMMGKFMKPFTPPTTTTTTVRPPKVWGQLRLPEDEYHSDGTGEESSAVTATAQPPAPAEPTVSSMMYMANATKHFVEHHKPLVEGMGNLLTFATHMIRFFDI